MLPRALLLLVLVPSAAPAATYYVNNQAGDDADNGTTAETPVATIARAVSMCETSDTLVLANTGKTYREPLKLGRLGGTPEKPLLIEGNGAVLSGLKTLEPDQWEEVTEGLYLFPLEKQPYGNPYLTDRGKRLESAGSVDSLASEQCFWDRQKGIYFRCAPDRTLDSYELAATLSESGFVTTSASYIICRNLICECFSNDGFNMHGDCRGIYLENVVARDNGDDGISIHECGGLVVRNAHVHHNTYGLQDVNASRSFYNGVLAENNQVGASFHGGFHSLVDCVIAGSKTDQIDVVADAPKHLIGSQYNPICRTTLFAKNVVLRGSGNRAGIRVRNGAHAVVENSVILGSLAGVVVEGQGQCHLTTSAIADCEISISSDSVDVFRDFNVYHPGRIKWRGTDYVPEQWEAFRTQAGHDEHSKIEPVTVAEDGIIHLPPDVKMEKRPGPTQPVSLHISPGGNDL